MDAPQCWPRIVIDPQRLGGFVLCGFAEIAAAEAAHQATNDATARNRDNAWVAAPVAKPVAAAAAAGPAPWAISRVMVPRMPSSSGSM
jgi:hypothetical protein